jgi:hypothetical protein
MGRSMTTEAARLAFGHAFDECAAVSSDSGGLEQHKLDRLLELRAVIDSLRAERAQELLSGVRAG